MVTGANGFIGKHLVNTLVDQGCFVVPTVRAIPVGDEIAVGNVGPHTDWSIPLKKKTKCSNSSCCPSKPR